MKKLHLGAGDHPLPGWINTDIAHGHGNHFLDATKKFPFDDNEIDRIFSEHMIEHLPLEGGLNMISECYRILVPGGRVRISTPDLVFLCRLVTEPTIAKDKYIEWSCRCFCKGLPICAETVVNNFVRAWGHQFIWSSEMLTEEMERVGFCSFDWLEVSRSSYPEFTNLENISRMPPGFLQLETMTIEGMKPDA